MDSTVSTVIQIDHTVKDSSSLIVSQCPLQKSLALVWAFHTKVGGICLQTALGTLLVDRKADNELLYGHLLVKDPLFHLICILERMGALHVDLLRLIEVLCVADLDLICEYDPIKVVFREESGLTLLMPSSLLLQMLWVLCDALGDTEVREKILGDPSTLLLICLIYSQFYLGTV